MRLVLCSDTHGQHRRIHVPDGDVFIFAGDMEADSLEAVREFNEWIGTLPHRHKIVIAGNHDWAFQRTPLDAQSLMTNATYLQDSGCEIDGVKFWGSPWTPTFFDWAFMLNRGSDIEEKWNLIPDDTDVLITHGPPYGILDQPLPNFRLCGCQDLMLAVERIKPQLHVFGHIHRSRGLEDNEHTVFVNASVLDEAYRYNRLPLINFEIAGVAEAVPPIAEQKGGE